MKESDILSLLEDIRFIRHTIGEVWGHARNSNEDSNHIKFWHDRIVDIEKRIATYVPEKQKSDSSGVWTLCWLEPHTNGIYGNNFTERWVRFHSKFTIDTFAANLIQHRGVKKEDIHICAPAPELDITAVIRTGRVSFSLSYLVDMNSQEMIDDAIECIDEYISNAVKFNSIRDMIQIEEDPDADPNDIPDFLKENSVDIEGENDEGNLS